MTKDYNPTIDALKGILILFVILGHLLPGTLYDSFPRYSIYAFHMPLFIFISGYLFNLERLSQLSFKTLFKKYWKRMLLEWGIAWIVYTTIVLWGNFSIHNLLVKVVYPFYHLWYVPALFIMILLLVGLYKFLGNKWTTYISLFCLTALLTAFCYYKRILTPSHVALFSIFLIGTLLHNGRLVCGSKHGWILVAGSILLFIAALVFIWHISDIPDRFINYTKYAQIPCSIMICVFCLMPMIETRLINSKILSFIGRNSLHFYLWHMLPVVIINYKDFVQ